MNLNPCGSKKSEKTKTPASNGTTQGFEMLLFMWVIFLLLSLQVRS